MDTNFSPELKKVLADSTKQALRHNVAVIQPEHLLMALISDSDSKGFRLIEKAADKLFGDTRCSRTLTNTF